MNKNKFYKENNLIISTEFSTPWTIARGIWKITNSFHIKQKSSLKWYIWINKTLEKKVIIKNIYFWDNISKNYKEEKLDYEIIEKLESFIFWKLIENNINYWLEINFLSEVWRWHWLGFSWIFSSLISTVFHIISNKLEIKNLGKIFQLNNFREIFDFSYNLEKILRYDKTIWLNGFVSFMNTQNPILIFTDNWKINYNIIWEKDSHIPLDYYIIFSGIPSKTKRVEKELEKWNKESLEISNFLEKELKNLNIENHYLKKFINSKKIEENYENIFNILNIKLLKNFKNIIDDFCNENDIEDFIKNIDEYRKINNVSGEYSEFLNIFEKSFYKNKKSLQNNIWILPIYWGKIGWWYLVVSKENTNREVIKQTVKDILTYFPNSYIEYCSYENKG